MGRGSPRPWWWSLQPSSKAPVGWGEGHPLHSLPLDDFGASIFSALTLGAVNGSARCPANIYYKPAPMFLSTTINLIK